MNKVKIEFSEKKLTRNAGLVNVGRFIDKLNLPAILSSKISITRGNNAVYSISDVICMLILGVFSGAKHMAHLTILSSDSVLKKIFNWDRFPDSSTFSRVFKLFKHDFCHELSEAEDVARRKVWKKKWFGRVTLDFDSSVDGVYGNQEGAEVGYNPKKQGQKSYHPLFCFIAETRECLHNWFRAGSAYSANGIVEFAKECFERLPKGVWKVFVRGDSAFFYGAFLDFLESVGALYLIKVKMAGLKQLLEGMTWKKARYGKGFEITEFWHQCKGWKAPRRFVAVRTLVPIVKQDPLFPGFIAYEYQYFCYVTNDDSLTPLKAHKKYGQRATSENWIEWTKNQMSAGSILTDHFWANSAIFQTCVLAYNLHIWMMTLVTGKKVNQEPNTIRFWLIFVPGRLLTGKRQLTLNLQEDWIYKNKWLQVETALERLEFS